MLPYQPERKFYPAGTLILCPICHTHMYTTINDLYQYDVVKAVDVVTFDGATVVAGEEVRCPSCGPLLGNPFTNLVAPNREAIH